MNKRANIYIPILILGLAANVVFAIYVLNERHKLSLKRHLVEASEVRESFPNLIFGHKRVCLKAKVSKTEFERFSEKLLIKEKSELLPLAAYASVDQLSRIGMPRWFRETQSTDWEEIRYGYYEGNRIVLKFKYPYLYASRF